MAVAKRQVREKPMKIEQRKVRGPDWGLQVEQTALLASPIYIRQAQGEEEKNTQKEEPKGWGPLSLSASLPLSLCPSVPHSLSACLLSSSLPCSPALSLFLLFASFGSACLHASRMYFPLFSKWNWDVTRSCNTDLPESCDTVCPRAGPSLQIFVVMRQNWVNYTLPWHIQQEIQWTPRKHKYAIKQIHEETMWIK